MAEEPDAEARLLLAVRFRMAGHAAEMIETDHDNEKWWGVFCSVCTRVLVCRMVDPNAPMDICDARYM